MIISLPDILARELVLSSPVCSEATEAHRQRDQEHALLWCSQPEDPFTECVALHSMSYVQSSASVGAQ